MAERIIPGLADRSAQYEGRGRRIRRACALAGARDGQLGDQRLVEDRRLPGGNLCRTSAGCGGAGSFQAVRVVQQDVRVRGSRLEESRRAALAIATECTKAQAQP